MIIQPPRFLEPIAPWLGSNLKTLFTGDWVGFRVILTGFCTAAVCILAVTIHECGHLLAGLSMRFRFKVLRVWKVQVDRNLRLSRYDTSDIGGLGWTRFFPEEMRNRRQRVAFMLLAGPLANLISGFVWLILPLHKSLVGGSFILISFFLGFTNLLPFRRAQSTSDGMRLLTLLFKPARYERWLALAQIIEARSAGVAIDQILPDLIVSLTGEPDKSLETVLAHWLAYAVAYDHHKDSEAAELLETCLRYAGFATPSLREALIANAGIFQAGRRKRIDLAEQWLGDLRGPLHVPYRRLMVEGAILEAQENFSGALEKVHEIEKAILTTSKPEQQQASLRQFAKWRAELEQKVESFSSPVAPDR